jgi:hypothetical protein
MPTTTPWTNMGDGQYINSPDFPTCCPKCGARTEFDTRPDGIEEHTCLNVPECGFMFEGYNNADAEELEMSGDDEEDVDDDDDDVDDLDADLDADLDDDDLDDDDFDDDDGIIGTCAKSGCTNDCRTDESDFCSEHRDEEEDRD